MGALKKGVKNAVHMVVTGLSKSKAKKLEKLMKDIAKVYGGNPSTERAKKKASE